MEGLHCSFDSRKMSLKKHIFNLKDSKISLKSESLLKDINACIKICSILSKG